MKIRTKSRKELDLEWARKVLADMRDGPKKSVSDLLTSAALVWCICEDVINALEAALSVKPIIFCAVENSARADGWDEAIDAVRQAGGYIDGDDA